MGRSRLPLSLRDRVGPCPQATLARADNVCLNDTLNAVTFRKWIQTAPKQTSGLHSERGPQLASRSPPAQASRPASGMPRAQAGAGRSEQEAPMTRQLAFLWSLVLKVSRDYLRFSCCNQAQSSTLDSSPPAPGLSQRWVTPRGSIRSPFSDFSLRRGVAAFFASVPAAHRDMSSSCVHLEGLGLDR